jgi:hypothetical protein
VRYVAPQYVSQATPRKTAGLVALPPLEWAFFQLKELQTMRVKRRLLPNFEAYSVTLFAGLALGGAIQARSHLSTLLAPLTQSSSAPERPAVDTKRWAPEADRAVRGKDGSVSSPDFDESLK